MGNRVKKNVPKNVKTSKRVGDWISFFAFVNLNLTQISRYASTEFKSGDN